MADDSPAPIKWGRWLIIGAIAALLVIAAVIVGPKVPGYLTAHQTPAAAAPAADTTTPAPPKTDGELDKAPLPASETKETKTKTLSTTTGCTTISLPNGWRKSGGDPYATSQFEAFSDAKMDRFLACAAIPTDDRDEIKTRLRGDGSSKLVHLHKGDQLKVMMSGGGVAHEVTVELDHDQDALYWAFSVNGHDYVFILPLGCWNWSLGPNVPPPEEAKVEQCAVLSADVEVGEKVRIAISAAGELPSGCWAHREGGEGEWPAWPGRCDDCSWVMATSVVPNYKQRELREPGWSIARKRHQEWRVPLLVAQRDYIGLCRENAKGEHSCTTWVEPSDWKKPEYVHTVGHWQWTNCPD